MTRRLVAVAVGSALIGALAGTTVRPAAAQMGLPRFGEVPPRLTWQTVPGQIEAAFVKDNFSSGCWLMYKNGDQFALAPAPTEACQVSTALERP
jgi:hypothetical protein